MDLNKMFQEKFRFYARPVLAFTTVAAVLLLLYVKGPRLNNNYWKTQGPCITSLNTKMDNIQHSVGELSVDIKSHQDKVPAPVPIPVPAKPTPKQAVQALPFKKKIPWQGIAYKRTNGSWVADDSMCTEDEVFDQATLKTPAGNTPIFIHDVVKDHSVSKYLKTVGNWEPDVMYTAFEALKENKDHVFVDIGGNIGTFSLAAAKLGHRVISVEPYAMNTKRLCRGVVKGGFAGQMFVIHNAMSELRETLSFKLHPNDIAMTRVEKVTNSTSNTDTVTSIQMNDLLELFDMKSAVIKLDCEDHEVEVMKGAEIFFQKVDVRMVLIEWDKLIVNQGTLYIIEMMKRFNFKPYNLGKNAKALDMSEYTRWKNRNVVFKKV
ncbi:uncharacterized protein [Haliotis cracherodii]|uniref:uncharacterized protein n=1 Tax=Haliotis cracherodii TaxID=6455 RepID=UPI0039EC4CFC